MLKVKSYEFPLIVPSKVWKDKTNFNVLFKQTDFSTATTISRVGNAMKIRCLLSAQLLHDHRGRGYYPHPINISNNSIFSLKKTKTFFCQILIFSYKIFRALENFMFEISSKLKIFFLTTPEFLRGWGSSPRCLPPIMCG